MGSKAPSGSKNYYGHCAGIICQGQLDFISGLLINNTIEYPNAAVWDSGIFQAGRIILVTYSGSTNAYQTPDRTDQPPIIAGNPPPNPPWQLFASQWASGGPGYNVGDLVVANGTMIFKSLIGSNMTTPPVTATSNADWQYHSSPDNWSTIGNNHFWPAGSIVAWEGQIYTTIQDTSSEPPAAPWTLFQVLRANSPNPLVINVPTSTSQGRNSGPGTYYLYWGTPDQVLDPTGEAILTSLGHPPYRNCAIIVGKNILFGTQTLNPPSLQVLGGRAPVQSIITGPATSLDADWQANPWCILAELLTHPIWGLGLPESWFDAATWNAEANRCYANPQLFYISPMYTSLKKISELVADLMLYPDAFIFWSTIATLTAGHWPHGEAPPAFTNANTVNQDNITKEFNHSSEGWWGTINSVAVSIQDIQAAFKSRPCIAPNLFNMAVTKRLLTQKIDRPWITRYAQGLAWATEMSKILGDQMSSGTIELQAEKAGAILPGSLFLLTDDQFQTSEVQRCTKRVTKALPAGKVELTHATERGVAPQPYSPTQVNPAPAAGPPPARIVNYATIQLPTALGGDEPDTLAVLAGRESGFTSALQVWFQQADASAFQLLGTNGAFAVAGWFDTDANNEIIYGMGNDSVAHVDLGQVTQGNTYNVGDTDFWQYTVNYSSNSGGFPFTTATEGTDYTIDPTTGNLTIVTGGNIPTGDYVFVKFWNTLAIAYDPLTPATDVDAISAALTQDEINDGELLLIAVSAANPANYEIMSVRSVQAVGTDPGPSPYQGDPVLFVKVFRAQFGTQLGGPAGLDWGLTNDQVFIIPRASLNPLSHSAFPGLIESASTAKFILAPQSAWVDAAITDLYDVANNPTGLSDEFTYTFYDIFAPTVTWIQQQKNGTNISSFSGTFLTTDDLYFSFQLNSTQDNIIGASLTGQIGEQQLTLWSQNFAPTGQANLAVNFSFPSPGLWNLFVNVLCSDGNQIAYPLTLPGSPTEVQVQVNTATSYAPTPILSEANYTRIGRTITGLKLGPMSGTLTVLYQLQPRGTAYNPSGWSTAGSLGSGMYGPVPNFAIGAKTLYAKSQESGDTDSPVVSWNL